MSNSESGSSQFPLRRSTRLLGKSTRSPRLLGKTASTMKHSGQTSIPKPRKKTSIPKARQRHVLVAEDFPRFANFTLAQFKQSIRRSHGCIFRQKYIYDGSIDKRVYINSSGDTCSWTDKSTGCTWVAVYGMKLMCVAFRRTLDPARYPGFSPNIVRRLYTLNVISEIEDIALSTSDSRQTLDKHATRPFGVVSLIPSTAGQASGDEASGALKYLKERFASGVDFSRDETMQTTINALQRECNQEFTADDDIWVYRLEWNNEHCLQRDELKKLLADVNTRVQTKEIKEHLGVINKPLLH